MTESKFLKLARVQSGLTQGQLAKKMGYGSSQFVSNVERALAALPPSHMKDFIKYTKADPEQLVKVKVQAYRKWLRSYL
jgi:ribosome-binding protein aMBF1 (putative translation factor)